jgi:hypothetical protein
MYNRTVSCGAPGCGAAAEYKIAAPWSAGRFSELKTYGLACEQHYVQVYRDALTRRKDHPPSSEEAQGEIAVYRFEKGKAGAALQQVPNPQ